MTDQTTQLPISGSSECNIKPIRGNRGGFDIRDGYAITLEEELRILKESGFKIDRTEVGTMISRIP